MRSHSRAIHNNKAIPSRIIRSRVTDNSKATRSKVEGIKDILSRGMSNNKIIPSRDIHNKVTLSRVMANSKTISNRVMDNHLPGKTCRPGNCP